MYLKRDIDITFTEWKNSEKRKPLLLRGARQVGKTDSVRNLAKSFDHYIEINFESDSKLAGIFEKDLKAERICRELAAIFLIPITEGKTLLFLDEIQACPRAIQALRFFYEQKPGLHVIAAGSLIEFALQKIPTFGVGRIRSVFIYPLSFNEFLSASGKDMILDFKRKGSPANPISAPVHDQLLEYQKMFMLTGGMPEVAASYIEKGDIIECRRVIDDLIYSYMADFAKYEDNFPADILKDIFDSVVDQTGGKFVYSKAGGSSHYLIKKGLDLLISAGVVIPVRHSSANGIPLGAQVNSKKQKMLILDTGIFLRILGLDMAEYFTSDDFQIINKGCLAEMFTGLELMKYRSPYEQRDLYYWHRESKSSNAEVDYVFSKNGRIIPVEVKAGTKGSMQSMNIFMREKGLSKGIRVSTENFSAYDNIEVYPLYAVENIVNNSQS